MENNLHLKIYNFVILKIGFYFVKQRIESFDMKNQISW